MGRIFVQLFDATLANWVGEAPGVCTLSKNCGHAGALEFNGDLYACDHFVFPEYKLGNILETPLTELMRGPRQTAFGDAKLRALPTQCRRCRYLFACNGECPRNRFERTREGRARAELSLQGLPAVFPSCGALHGLHAERTDAPPRPRQRDGVGAKTNGRRPLETLRQPKITNQTLRSK